jgi:hypothetical protein
VDNHALRYAGDVEYLIRRYGDRRKWDCFLLLKDADGRTGPVFKSFRTILPAQVTDCHGTTMAVPDYTADGIWREQTDRVRELFAADFDRVILLADSLNAARVEAGGFDGIAIYDNFVAPGTWRGHAERLSARQLLFSFNVNPGYDAVAKRHADPDACNRVLPFAPGGTSYDWSRSRDREKAAAASRARIGECLRTTVSLQTNASLANAKRNFFLTYINSFNEWHEGHQFEPMKDRASLAPDERAIGYHNPDHGRHRLEALRSLLAGVLAEGRLRAD